MPPPFMAGRAALPQPEKVRRMARRRRRRSETRRPKPYATIEDALARMVEQNSHLSAELALHLTRDGLWRNDDGSWSWKFDNRFYLIRP